MNVNGNLVAMEWTVLASVHSREYLMNTKRFLIAFALSATSFITTVNAAPTIFFGEDLGAGSAASIPNSIAARNAFVSRLTSFGLQNFESFSAGDIFPGCCGPLTFSGSSITADITGGRILDAPFNARFAISGTDYLNSSFNQRLTFSSPVAAFGVFVVDANEVDNNPATATQNGQLLSPAEIEARPFDTINGIFRIVTERSPGVFQVLFDSGTFPAPSCFCAVRRSHRRRQSFFEFDFHQRQPRDWM